LPLFDPKAEAEAIASRPEQRLDPGVVVRRVGDMVGRRRELRLSMPTLRDPERAGVVLHGMGGVGKSTLAAEVMHCLGAEGFVLASLAGRIEVDPLLSEVGQRLSGYARVQRLDERHPIREVARLLREPKELWRDRLDALVSDVLGEVPLALLLDNFEDNLDGGAVKDAALAELLALWAVSPGRSRLVLTCRYPFVLPEEAQAALELVHLGPLSFAETRKLILRLPGLNALPVSDQRRIYEDVGGHPRALEYLDALLGGGKARFTDVQKRLNAALANRGVKDPSRWCADTAGGLDAALAETVTLASGDVLLDDLLAEVEAQPLAKRLLLGASVYRMPVDETGLAWTVATPAERQAQIERVHQAWTEAQQHGQQLDLSPTEIEQYRRDIQEHRRPPIEVPEAFADACRLLGNLTLLSPVRYADDELQRFLVHRWTAGALQRRASEEERRAAHRAAADYWYWRQVKLAQSREQAIEDLLEVRFHHQAAGDRDMAVEVTGWICSQLYTLGAWEREQVLLMETLAWLPEQSAKAAAVQHQLGTVAHARGELDEALQRWRQSLAIEEQLGDRAGMASSYRHLGIVAQDRGDWDEALQWYRQSLAIFEQLGDRSGMAKSYHQLGMVAKNRGELDEALDWYRKALAIFEELGDRAGMAAPYFHLGTVAQARGDWDEALDWYRKALAIFEELGDRTRIATSYHQLGTVAQARGELDEALDWGRKALAMKEQLGHLSGLATSYHQLGNVAYLRGELDEALDWGRKALAIDEQLGHRSGLATSYHQLGIVAQARGDWDEALDWCRKALAIFEELGDRAHIASALSQIGILHTEGGDPAIGLFFNVQSLALRSQIRSPEIHIDLHWLARQREMLGQDRFRTLLIELLGEDGAATVEQWLRQQPQKSAAGT
jgi:tetratricopeptide (TPR) repeat protein